MVFESSSESKQNYKTFFPWETKENLDFKPIAESSCLFQVQGGLDFIDVLLRNTDESTGRQSNQPWTSTVHDVSTPVIMHSSPLNRVCQGTT